MKSIIFLLIASMTGFASMAQEDLPINAAINFAQFDKAVKGIPIEGYLCSITAEDPSVYSSLFTINQLNGALSAFHASFYSLVTSGNDEFIPVKEYEIAGKKAFLGTNAASEETPMNVLVVLYADLQMTLIINAETGIPIETLEEIVQKLVF